MDSLTLKVQGGAEEPYILKFTKHDNAIKGECNCTAGVYGKLCKHKLSLVSGSLDSLVDSEYSKEEISNFFENSTLKEMILEYAQLQENAADLKKKLNKIKNKIEKTFKNG